MTVEVLRAGLQATVQGAPRIGMRHLGVPASGAADPLSFALANRLVGNAAFEPGLEVTLTGVRLRFRTATAFAVTGAKADVTQNGDAVKRHRTLFAAAGDEVDIGGAKAGARSYLAVAGGFDVAAVLGSASTYLPAGFGGHGGRQLARGDVLVLRGAARPPAALRAPQAYRPPMSSSWALRACHGAEIDLLGKEDRFDLFDTNFTVGRRADRMGLQLDGKRFDVQSRGRLDSAPVFPGTVQCPENGLPFLLSVDAQTIGGYPRVAQVARADRHLVGQLRPGDHVRLLWRDPDSAREELRAKHDYWREWLPDVEKVI